MNRVRRAMPRRDRINHKSSARGSITRGEHPGSRRRKGVRINRDRAAPGRTDAGIGGDEGETGRLTDGKNHGIARNDVLTAFRSLEVQATFAVELHGPDVD